MSRVALITGTSTGLGESIALKLAAQGYKTYATMRNLAKASAELTKMQTSGALTLLPLDVQSTESVDAAVQQIIEKEGSIDLLINNAGAGYVRTTEQSTEEEVNWVTDVNYHGVVRTTKAVLPYMRAARSGHIINITSVGGLVGQPFNEFYCAAKFAVEGYTEALASYVQPKFGVRFSLVEPGGIKTEFANNALAQFQQSGGMIDDEYKPILEQYIGGASTRSEAGDGPSIYQTADEVADVVLTVVNADEAPLRVRTSEWAELLTQFKTKADPDGTQCRDAVTAMFL